MLCHDRAFANAGYLRHRRVMKEVQDDVVPFDVVPTYRTCRLGDKANADGAYPDNEGTLSGEDGDHQSVLSCGDAGIFNLCKSGES